MRTRALTHKARGRTPSGRAHPPARVRNHPSVLLAHVGQPASRPTTGPIRPAAAKLNFKITAATSNTASFLYAFIKCLEQLNLFRRWLANIALKKPPSRAKSGRRKPPPPPSLRSWRCTTIRVRRRRKDRTQAPRWLSAVAAAAASKENLTNYTGVDHRVHDQDSLR
jgi:hypothetical protein